MNNTSDKIISIIADKTGKEISELKPGLSFKDNLHIDSLDLYEIQMEVEKEFNISIDDESATTLTSIGLLIEYVEEKLK
jgi:acyl carrier protein